MIRQHLHHQTPGSPTPGSFLWKYAVDRVDPASLSTYEELTDPKWKGRILVRSSNNIYNQFLLASLLFHHGGAKAEIWARGIVANLARKPQGGDRDQLRGLALSQIRLN